jgi:hypothetical protein
MAAINLYKMGWMFLGFAEGDGFIFQATKGGINVVGYGPSSEAAILETERQVREFYNP